jgi:HEAT repeat protein
VPGVIALQTWRALGHLLVDDAAVVRNAALARVRRLPAEVRARALVAALTDPAAEHPRPEPGPWRAALAEALVDAGPAAVPALAELLGAKPPMPRQTAAEHRRLAIELLARIGEPSAAEALARHIGGPDDDLSLLAVAALGRVRGERAVRALASTGTSSSCLPAMNFSFGGSPPENSGPRISSRATSSPGWAITGVARSRSGGTWPGWKMARVWPWSLPFCRAETFSS